MEIEELEDVLDSSIITLLKSFGFRKGMRVPVVVINAGIDFYNLS